MKLTPSEKQHLKAIIGAGGMRRTDDILRFELAPEQEVDRAHWDAVADRLGEQVTALCRASCAQSDLVTYDHGFVTIFLHPHVTDRDPVELRAALLCRLSDFLNGLPEAPLSRAKVDRLSVSKLSGLQEQIRSKPGQAAGSLVSTATRSANDIGTTDGSAPPPPTIDLVTVALARGTVGAYFKPVQTCPNTLGYTTYYYDPAGELLEIDIALLREAALHTMRNIKAGKQEMQFIPININNMKKNDYRERLFFEIRQIPKNACALIAPVFVRVPEGLPSSILTEQVGYLKSGFSQVWTFAMADAKPETVPWPPRGCGVLLDGVYKIPLKERKPLLANWRRVAGRHGASIAVLAASQDVALI